MFEQHFESHTIKIRFRLLTQLIARGYEERVSSNGDFSVSTSWKLIGTCGPGCERTATASVSLTDSFMILKLYIIYHIWAVSS